MRHRNIFRSCLLSFLLLLAFSGVYAQQDPINQQLITAYFEALNRHDTTAIAGFYADTASLLSPNWEGAKKGRAAIREVWRRYFTSTPDLHYQVTYVLATPHTAVVEYDSFGTLSAPEAGTPDYMRNKAYRLHNITRFEISKGRITHASSFFDQVDFLKQVGFFDQKN